MMLCIAGLNLCRTKNIRGTQLYKMWSIMQSIILFLSASFFGFNCTSQGDKLPEQSKVLTLSQKIPLKDVRGRIDHIAYDDEDHLAFIAALGNNTIEVVNISTGKTVHTIKDLHEPQGLAYIASLKRLVVANG